MWSDDTYAHLVAAVGALHERVTNLQAILKAGPDLVTPDFAHRLLRGVEHDLQVVWAPVIWDANLHEIQRD